MTRNILLIVPSPQVARGVWADTGVGNWAAAFPLRLERAGLLDFDVADERALDSASGLADRGLAIVSQLPAAIWTETRRNTLRAFAGGVFVEGPVPPELFPTAPASAVSGAPAIVLCDAGDQPISLDLPPPQTRPMRLDPSLLPVAADATLEQRLAIAAAAYAARYCQIFARHNRLFPTESASAMAALALALVVERSAGAAHAAWLRDSLEDILAALPGRSERRDGAPGDVWTISLAMMNATRARTRPAPLAELNALSPVSESAVWNLVAPAAIDPSVVLGPPRASDPRLTCRGAFALWSVATFQRGETAVRAAADALALVEAIASGNIDAGSGDIDPWGSMLLAAAAWRAGAPTPALRAIWDAALKTPPGLAAPFRLSQGGCTLTGPPSESPFCALALASMCERIALPLPHPTDGLDPDLAAKAAWYRTPDMRTAFSEHSGQVLARRDMDGAAMVVRDGRLCASAVPLLAWIAQIYATPPLDETFVNRPMRAAKCLESWLIELFASLAASAGRPLLRVARWPFGKAFACTIAHDVDRIPGDAEFDRLLDWERRKGLKSSWYWVPSRLDPRRMERIVEAGFEIGLHAILAARKHEEAAAIAAATPAAAAVRGETLHGGHGADYWRGAAGVMQAHACGFAYTEHSPTAHDLPDTGFAVLRPDGGVEAVPIIGLTHAVCLERNPEKEDEVYRRESLDRLAAAGGYCLVSNHPDVSFAALCEWIEGLPLDRAWHATAAEVADWWRASHDRADLALETARHTADETEISVTSHHGVAGLVLQVPVGKARKVAVDGAKLVARHAGEAWVAVDVPRGETRIVRVRASDAIDRVALVRPPQRATASAADADPALPGLPESAHVVHLSHRARHLDPGRASATDPAFLYGPLDRPVDLMVVPRRVAGIFPNAFTAAWLGMLLADGDAQEILVEHGGDLAGRMMAEALRRWLPETAVDDADERRIWLYRRTGMAEAVAALPTAYPVLHRAFAGFRELYALVNHKDAAHFISGEGPAEAAFMYSMLGASRNSLVLERLASRFGWGSAPDIVDVGGGHGFLGMELAAKGWTATVIDHDPAKTELLGPWLVRRSPRRLAVSLHTRSMEALAAGGVPAGGRAPQAVTLFQSLLFCERSRVAEMLRACWACLAPGGALIIHELVRKAASEALHERRFERDELIGLVGENFGTPSLVSILDGKPMAAFSPGITALLVQKSEAPAAVRTAPLHPRRTESEGLAYLNARRDGSTEMEQEDAIPAAAADPERPQSRASAAGGVTLRPFPFPYQGMLAICSDIDQTTPAKFAALHRFLNTREETPLGQGLGLDVADSLWFYSLPGVARDPADQQMSFFAGLDWRQLSPFAGQILDYIRGGWIDTLHTYGNFSTLPAGSPGFTREHAGRALAVLAEAGLAIPIWINHGNRNNIQNIGDFDYMVGDLPRNPNQHSHLLYRHGVRFIWSGLVSGEFRRDAVIAPAPMRDGRMMWRFSRHDFVYTDDSDNLSQRFGAVTGSHVGRPIAMVWHPKLIHVQLSVENLRDLAATGGYAILGQHLGAGAGGEILPAHAIEALMRLKAAQDSGEILVARTSRLLEYACTRDHLRFEVRTEADGKIVIDVTGIDDPVRGLQAPLLHRLRGITFEVPGEGPVELRYRGDPIGHWDVVERRLNGKTIVGFTWFPPNHTDYAHARTR